MGKGSTIMLNKKRKLITTVLFALSLMMCVTLCSPASFALEPDNQKSDEIMNDLDDADNTTDFTSTYNNSTSEDFGNTGEGDKADATNNTEGIRPGTTVGPNPDACYVTIDVPDDVVYAIKKQYNGSGNTVSPFSDHVYELTKGVYAVCIKQEGYHQTITAFYVNDKDVSDRTKTIRVTPEAKGNNGYEPPFAIFRWNPEVEDNYYNTDSLIGYEEPDTPSFHEAKASNEFVTIEERYTYLNDCIGKSSDLYMYDLDTNTPVVFFTKKDLSNADNYVEAAKTLKKSPRLKIFLQAQIHGDEPSTGDSALYLISKLAGEYGKQVINEADICIIPCVNTEGGKNYNRYNNGYDMNRDSIAMRTKRMQNVHKLFFTLEPDVTMDNHESTYTASVSSEGNISRLDDVRIRGMNNPNTYSKLNNLSKSLMLSAFKDCRTAGLRPFFYQASGNSLWSSNFYGLSGSCSFIIESVGRMQGKARLGRRVFSNYVAVKSIIDNSIVNKTAIKSAVRTAKSNNVKYGNSYSSKRKFVLKTKKGSLETTVRPLINIDGTMVNPNRNDSMATRETSKTRVMPTGYIFSVKAKNAERTVAALVANNIKVYRLKAGTKVKAQQYYGTNSKAKLKKTRTVKFSKGAYFIPMNQQNRLIIAYSLEPDVYDNNAVLIDESAVYNNQDLRKIFLLTTNMNIKQLYRIKTDKPVKAFSKYIRKDSNKGIVKASQVESASQGTKKARLFKQSASDNYDYLGMDELE